MNPTPLRSLTRSAAVPSLRSARVIGRALGRPEMFRTHTPETTDGTNEVLRCSFCQKSQSDVRKLIAGPHVFICDECVDVCVDIIAGDQQREQPVAIDPEPSVRSSITVSCVLCQMPTPADDALVIRNRGFLCPGCVGEIEAAAAEG